MTTKAEEKARAKASLLNTLKPGDTLYCIVRSRSASGMQRVITPMALRWDAERQRVYPLYLSYDVATVLEMPHRTGERDGVVIRGAGYNQSQHIADGLAYNLWGKGATLRAEVL
jgi:hypothetical protein